MSGHGCAEAGHWAVFVVASAEELRLDAEVFEPVLQRQEFWLGKVGRRLPSLAYQLIELHAVTRPQDGRTDSVVVENEADCGSAQVGDFAAHQRAYGVELANPSLELFGGPALCAVVGSSEHAIGTPEPAEQPVVQDR